MKRILLKRILLLLPILSACHISVNEDKVRQQIVAHGQDIRDAFLKGDIETIASLHHPEVEKALGYNDLKKGREEVMEGLRQTLNSFSMEFIENSIESILINGDVAIEQTKFAIQLTPKDGGDSFIFRGRTLVTYVRSKESPTGWATIREIIQPAVN